MPSLSITKTYEDGDVLFEADLDNIKTDLETFINTTKLDDDNFQDNSITASDKFVAASISTAKIATSAITTSLFADDSVTSAKLADSASTDADRAVGTNHIRDSAVTTAKINDLAVTTAKIEDAAVTQAKRVALNYAISSSSSGSFSSSTIEDVDITNLSVSLTTNGNPVMVALIHPAYTGTEIASLLFEGIIRIQYLRDSNVFYKNTMNAQTTTGGSYAPLSLLGIDSAVTAGTYTYKAKLDNVSGSPVAITNCRLLAWELY